MPLSDPSSEEAPEEAEELSSVPEADGSSGDEESKSETSPQPTTDTEPESSSDGASTDPAKEMSEEAARRLLDSVDEGSPRSRGQPARHGGKDW